MYKKVTQYNFPEGVTIIVPYIDMPVQVFQLPMTMEGEFPPHSTNFRMIRPVINLKVRRADLPNSPIGEFEFALMLRVHYTYLDFEEVYPGKELWLGYFDGVKWVRLDRNKHSFYLLPDNPDKPELGGIGTAKIYAWDDPMIAWGD